MILKHYNAVMARIAAEPDLAERGHSAAREDENGQLVRDTYWILFGGGPDELDDERLTQEQQPDSDAEFVYTVRSVSITADGAMRQAALIYTQLVGHRLTVEGRTCRATRHTGAAPVQPDNRIRPPLFYVDDEYTVYSSRA